MRQRSVFDYDVSVTADKRRRQRARGHSGAFETGQQCCDWPGCDAAPAYRAPHSRERLDEYRWFCLEHVREYNAAWNYYEALSDEEMDAQFARERVWERPTWGLGSGPKQAQGMGGHRDGRAWARFGFADVHDVLGESATLNPAAEAGAERPRRRLTREEQQAMDTLGLPHQVEGRAEVRARYRELVKELHPDMNGGENPAPDRLARVLRAWSILRKSRAFTD